MTNHFKNKHKSSQIVSQPSDSMNGSVSSLVDNVNKLTEKLQINEGIIAEERALSLAAEKNHNMQLDMLFCNQKEMDERLKELEYSKFLMQQQLNQMQKYNNKEKSPVEDEPDSAAEQIHFQCLSLTCVEEIEFPDFDGENPRAWIRRCSRYFKILNVHPNERVFMASLNLVGEAKNWYREYFGVEYEPDWLNFATALLEKFDNLEPVVVVGEFNKLQQIGSVPEYTEKFEELKFCMSVLSLGVTEKYFVASFISGLKEEIKGKLTMLKPKNLTEATTLARKEEAKQDAITRRADKNAFQNPYEAKGTVKGTDIKIVISTGSTHTFLDEGVAEILKCDTSKCTAPMLFHNVFGNEIVSETSIPGFEWYIRGQKFSHTVRVVNKLGCDMMVGTDWISRYYPVSFGEGEMTISVKGKKVCIIGNP